MVNMMSGGMMGNYGGGMMGYFGWGGPIMGILLIILIGATIFFVLKTAKGTGLRLSNETPLDILKIRYAKSEISEEEYEKMKKALEK